MSNELKAARIIAEALKINLTAERAWALGYICCTLNVGYDDLVTGRVTVSMNKMQNNVLQAIKEFRQVHPTMGLKESKQFVDGEREVEFTKEQWFILRPKLEALGASYSVKDA